MGKAGDVHVDAVRSYLRITIARLRKHILANSLRNSAMLKEVEEIEAMVDKLDLPTIPIVDTIRDIFGMANTADITGRIAFVQRSEEDGKWVIRSRKESKESDVHSFQIGSKRVALISTLLAQGISLHSNSRSPARRTLLICESYVSASKLVQLLGRVHRNGQVCAPEVISFCTSHPGAKRWTTSALSSLRSLGALTAGSTRNKASISLGSSEEDGADDCHLLSTSSARAAKEAL
eukprot:7381807-Prymnesium_polylepis.1